MNSADAIDRLKSFALDYTMSDFSRGALLDAIDAVRETEGRYLATLTDEGLNGLGYVKLPVDAEGVPIRIGDVMEFTYDPPQDQPLFEVSGFGANGTLFYAARGEVAPRKTTNASVVRHHHAPTVEDVLRELVRVMAYCMQQGRDCDGCAVNGADGVVTAPSGCDTLRDRMREMGVVE